MGRARSGPARPARSGRPPIAPTRRRAPPRTARRRTATSARATASVSRVGDGEADGAEVDARVLRGRGTHRTAELDVQRVVRRIAVAQPLNERKGRVVLVAVVTALLPPAAAG